MEREQPVDRREHPSGSSPLRTGFIVLVAAMCVRGVICFSSLDSYDTDPDAYRAIAQGLSATHVFGLLTPDGEPVPTAFRPPLYPFVLSWWVAGGQLASWSVAALHTLLGAITVLLTYLTAGRLIGFSSRWVGILASILVLVDPILLQQSTQVMTETLATLLAAGVLLSWTYVVLPSNESGGARGDGLPEARARWRPLYTLGLLLAMAYLCRPTFLVWGGLLICGLWVFEVRSRVAHVWLRVIVLSVLFMGTVGLWTARNWQVMGHPVWATTHGGYTLLLANNPSFYDYLRDGEWGQPWDFANFENAYAHRYDGDPRTAEFWDRTWAGPTALERGTVEGLTEVSDDRLAYEAARATIGREPAMFVWSCLVRAARLWSPFPHSTGDRSTVLILAVGGWYLLITGLAIVGFCQVLRRTRTSWITWWPVASLLLTLTVVHAVYWSNMRMRAPAIPAVSLLAAAAWSRQLNSARTPRTHVSVESSGDG